MARNVLSGKDNTNGFQKNPQNINKTGANRNPISAILKRLGDGNIIELEYTITNSDGEKKTTKLDLSTKKSINEAISVMLLQKAMKGDLKAIDMVLDRQEGKALQTSDIKLENIIKYKNVSKQFPDKE